MRKRTKAREFAIQLLYQIDITGEAPALALANFWDSQDDAVEDEVRAFTAGLVEGAVAERARIDDQLMKYSNNWDLARMAVVDRNILRLGSYELICRQDIPPKVTINEAVDLAKKYSGEEAGKFVNGILDKINKEVRG